MNRWRPDTPYPWVNNELPPDPLGDMATSGCKLSVWLIKEDFSNLEDIISAIVATGDYISNFDYILFDESLLQQLNIEVVTQAGDTPDSEANRFHRDIVKLTAVSLVAITHSIYRKYKDIKRVQEKRIVRLIADAIHRQRFNISDLRGEVKGKLGDFMAQNSSGP